MTLKRFSVSVTAVSFKKKIKNQKFNMSKQARAWVEALNRCAAVHRSRYERDRQWLQGKSAQQWWGDMVPSPHALSVKAWSESSTPHSTQLHDLKTSSPPSPHPFLIEVGFFLLMHTTALSLSLSLSLPAPLVQLLLLE